MRKLFILCFLSSGLLQCGSQDHVSRSSFYSADAHEVELSFSDYIFVPVDELTGQYPNLDDLSAANEEDQEILLAALKLQVLHLYGVFTYHERPVDFSTMSGTIYEENLPVVTKVELLKSRGLVRLDYTYRDRGVFYHWLLENESRAKINFYLPNQPTTIYEETMPKSPRIDPVTKEPVNPCTSEKDNSELAFWYYWSPDREGCSKGIFSKLHLVEATFKRLPSTKRTFPVYRELHQDQLQITLIIGQDEYFARASDAGLKTFNYMNRYYQGLKHFSYENLTPHHTRFTYLTDRYRSTFDLHYVDTETTEFDDLAYESLKFSDVLIFTGHSYEGYYFDLERLFEDPEESLPKDRYQVMFFNSCTTTSYYGDNFFAAKKTDDDPRGTKRLDLITNAIGAPFDDVSEDDGGLKVLTADMILVNSMLGLDGDGRVLKRLLSWQEILGLITDNAGFDYSALTSVNGDEDNPKRLAADLKVPKPLL